MTTGSATVPARTPLALGTLVTSVGGAAGALARWTLTDLSPVPAGHFPWTIFCINVLGSGLLAALPALAAVRSRHWLGLLLGTGVLGGFTTMSAASVETFDLLDRGHLALGLAYCLGTLAAALMAVLLIDRLTTDEQRHEFEIAEGDE